MSIILKVENISKQYRLGLVGTGTLAHDLNRFWHSIRGKKDPYLKIGGVNDRSAKATNDYVWALENINFDVQKGEVLGIIGKNGAGKSTLLKILSRVTSPSTGVIKTKGRIASLLEVGTGFHPELTGKENVYLNGAILGMTKAEINAKLDEIVAFSGCEMYIDTPVKRYSSGMKVRLAFAVAAHLEPDILIVDEVLAVGDAEFQRKAIGKMQSISKSYGRTVLFVSHNMAAVKSLCTKAIVLEHGTVVFSGGVDDAIDNYLSVNLNKNIKYRSIKNDDVPHIKSIDVITNRNEYFQDFQKDFQIKFVIYSPDGLIDPAISYQITNVNEEPLVHELNLNNENVFCNEKGLYEVTSYINPLNLYPGAYKINVFFADNFLKVTYDRLLNACSFEVLLDEKRDYYFQKGSAIYKENNTSWEVKKQ